MPPLEIQPELAADAAVRAVACQQVVAAKRVGAVRRLDLGGDAGVILADRQHLVLEAQIDQAGKIGAALDQILLDVILLKIDEGRRSTSFRPGMRPEIERLQLRIDASSEPTSGSGRVMDMLQEGLLVSQ